MLTGMTSQRDEQNKRLVTYLSRTSCSTSVAKDDARKCILLPSFSHGSVLVSGHAGFLLTQSFFLLFEEKIGVYYHSFF